MKNLEFRKESKILGVKCGYYFKGEFLSRYKTEAIRMLRERIEHAGSQVGDCSQTNWEKGIKALPDEAKVIFDEYQKAKKKTDSTHNKKKPYYKELHKRGLRRSLITLSDRIRMKEMRKSEIIQGFDKEIQEIKKQMVEVEKELNS
jgi:hypothetical protein